MVQENDLDTQRQIHFAALILGVTRCECATGDFDRRLILHQFTGDIQRLRRDTFDLGRGLQRKGGLIVRGLSVDHRHGVEQVLGIMQRLDRCGDFAGGRTLSGTVGESKSSSRAVASTI
ncbi:hypothetical protein ACWEO2_30055 [Nocardia sp. NPDC004278]